MGVARAIVVSPRKSGTHLVQELMMALGYQIHGESLPSIDNVVALSLRQRSALRDQYLHPDLRDAVDPAVDLDGFVATTNALWRQVAEIWQRRLGADTLTNTELSYPELGHTVLMRPDAWRLPFADTPAGVCWIFHSMDVWRSDRRFLDEWQRTGQPRFVLNHRDPRDAVVSMMNFLSGESGHVFTRQPEAAVLRPILRNITDPADRVTFLLRDRSMPLLADFDSAATLALHPSVCVVSFEELVGPDGGGTKARQVAAVRRVAEHVDAGVDAEAVAEKLFNSAAYSFHRGRIGAWHDLFTPLHRELFAERFGHLLEVFGYGLD